MGEVTLLVDGQKFTVSKDLLSEYSDYFRAMFSGNYIETEKKEIAIDVVDSYSMDLVMHYMRIGVIELSGYDLSVIRDLTAAASYLQVTELIRQIEYTLDISIKLSNWANILGIAQEFQFTKLEKTSAIFGLLSFEEMKPEYIQSIKMLHWYLSHPHLYAKSEFDIFKFGLDWITRNDLGPDASLIVLGCLDLKRVTTDELNRVKDLMLPNENSLSSTIVDCLCYLSKKGVELESSVIKKEKEDIFIVFSQGVYNEVANLIQENKDRIGPRIVPVMPMRSVQNEKVTSLYLFKEKRIKKNKFPFKKWLQLTDFESNLWGFNIISWGLTRIVVVGGEISKGTGIFNRDVKVYDTVRETWTEHGVKLPKRRHCGVAIMGDSLYLIGGVGGFRITSHSALVYDLVDRKYRHIANLPEAIQSPAVCSHKGSIYAAGRANFFKYEEIGEGDRWKEVFVDTHPFTNAVDIVSFKEYIYCTEFIYGSLYRFNPDCDVGMQLIAKCSRPPAAVLNFGNRLLFYTRSVFDFIYDLGVEEYVDNETGNINVLWETDKSLLKINDVAGLCVVVKKIPPLYPEVSKYANTYLRLYTEVIETTLNE